VERFYQPAATCLRQANKAFLCGQNAHAIPHERQVKQHNRQHALPTVALNEGIP
jgi:hypothetical protein